MLFSIHKPKQNFHILKIADIFQQATQHKDALWDRATWGLWQEPTLRCCLALSAKTQETTKPSLFKPWLNQWATLQYTDHSLLHGQMTEIDFQPSCPSQVWVHLQSPLLSLRNVHQRMAFKKNTLSFCLAQLTASLKIPLTLHYRPNSLATQPVYHFYPTDRSHFHCLQQLAALQKIKYQWDLQQNTPTLLVTPCKRDTVTLPPLRGFWQASVQSQQDNTYHLKENSAHSLNILSPANHLRTCNQFIWPYSSNTSILWCQPQSQKPAAIQARFITAKTDSEKSKAHTDDNQLSLLNDHFEIQLTPTACSLKTVDQQVQINLHSLDPSSQQANALSLYSAKALDLIAQHTQLLCQLDYKLRLKKNWQQRIKNQAWIESQENTLLVSTQQSYHATAQQNINFHAEHLTVTTQHAQCHHEKATLCSPQIQLTTDSAPLQIHAIKTLRLHAGRRLILSQGQSCLEITSTMIRILTPSLIIRSKQQKIEGWTQIE